jgi:hypothetical protein
VFPAETTAINETDKPNIAIGLRSEKAIPPTEVKSHPRKIKKVNVEYKKRISVIIQPPFIFYPNKFTKAH